MVALVKKFTPIIDFKVHKYTDKKVYITLFNITHTQTYCYNMKYYIRVRYSILHYSMYLCCNITVDYCGVSIL